MRAAVGAVEKSGRAVRMAKNNARKKRSRGSFRLGGQAASGE